MIQHMNANAFDHVNSTVFTLLLFILLININNENLSNTNDCNLCHLYSIMQQEWVLHKINKLDNTFEICCRSHCSVYSNDSFSFDHGIYVSRMQTIRIHSQSFLGIFPKVGT